mgnify:CR=1 FL=1
MKKLIALLLAALVMTLSLSGLAAGRLEAIKAAGKLSVEGKDYVLRDGDICHFLFNV